MPVSYESAKACAVVVDNTETQSDAIIARSNAISGAMLPDDVSKEYSSASSSSSPSVLSEYFIYLFLEWQSCHSSAKGAAVSIFSAMDSYS